MTSMRGVIGHRQLLERLVARVRRNELAHAYGLYGPRSIGKRTVAVRLAQTLGCLDPAAPPGGCGRCLACRKIEGGAHPDVRLVERDPTKKDISIEQIREMQQDIVLRPLEARTRLVVIDDAADLNEFAQDALLKTLEEPPPHAVLLLLTRQPADLHETIRSRLQPLHLRAVPAVEIAAGLVERGVKDADAIAAAANGLPGLALRLATDEGGERSARRALERELLTVVASGLTDRFAWAADLNARFADDERGRRDRTEAIRSRLGHWAELFRDAAVRATGSEDPPLRPERATETAAIARAVTSRELVDAALLVEQLRRDLEWNANARAMLELVALKLPYVPTARASA